MRCYCSKFLAWRWGLAFWVQAKPATPSLWAERWVFECARRAGWVPSGVTGRHIERSEISLCMKVLDPSLCSGWQEAGGCHVERRRNIPLRKNLFCSFLSFCCDQKERNATKERKNAAKTKSGIFLLKLWKSLCSSEFQQKNSDFVIGWMMFIGDTESMGLGLAWRVKRFLLRHYERSEISLCIKVLDPSLCSSSSRGLFVVGA